MTNKDKEAVFTALGKASMCWSETPKGEFDSKQAELIGNRLIDDLTIGALQYGEGNFGQAINALKQGKRVARIGWNGKKMFLFLLPSGIVSIKAIHDLALRQVIESEVGGETFEALGSIRMFTADKKILTGWLASQTDMLAEDWTIVE